MDESFYYRSTTTTSTTPVVVSLKNNRYGGRIIGMEGIICAGKTVRCSLIPGATVIGETHINNPYLDKFYSNPKKWAYPMQMHMHTGREKNYMIAGKLADEYGKIVVMDRSVFSDEVFAYTNQDNMTSDQWKKYWDHRNKFFSNPALRLPDLIEYLYVSPKVCHSRIKKRALENSKLECENIIPLSYLELLEEEYNPKWINKMRDLGCPVKIINWQNFGNEYKDEIKYGCIFDKNFVFENNLIKVGV